MNNIFRDEYTDFTFNGVRSSQMKVWITNSGDLQFRLTPEFSDTFISPSFSNTQILNGTNITKSTFAIKCIAVDITMQEWRAIQRWLSPTAVGRLSFDFNDGTYYNAKIDKSISGTSFVKGGINNLGDRYIVEFSVGFVTVGDYAALGEVNVGILGKNFGDNIKIGVDSYGNSIEDKYKIESVSNNRYFMPSISKLSDKILENTFNSIGGKTLKIKHGTTNIALIFDFSLKEGEEIQPLYRINSITNDENKNQIQIVKTVIGKDKSEFSKDIDDEGYAYLSFYGENLFLYPLDIDSIDVLNSNNNYAICNTGSYDLYPSLLLNAKNFSIKKNNEDYYSYDLRNNAIISIDGQNGFVLSQGQHIENVSCLYENNSITYENILVNKYTNNGILDIECGKPQIIKGYYKGNKKLIQPYTEGEGEKATTEERTIGYINTFISPEKLNYDYHSNLAIHIFKDITNMQKFNTASYPIFIQEGNNNSYHFEFIDSYFTNDCYAYCIERDGYYEYNIITQSDDKGNDTLSLQCQYSTYFISICNYDTLTIEVDEDSTANNNFIYLQTRDAF